MSNERLHMRQVYIPGIANSGFSGTWSPFQVLGSTPQGCSCRLNCFLRRQPKVEEAFGEIDMGHGLPRWLAKRIPSG